MDDRKKQIGELEQRKREQTASLDTLLTRLGEALFGRAAGVSQEDTSFGELAVYQKLKNDITASETSIQAVEEQIRRFRELEEGIEAKELEEAACTKELAIMYGRLGKSLMETSTGDYADFCLPYREQADALLTKVLSLEERISGLEEKEGGNVFSWIGKGAQGLVLRSFLTKAQESLEQLRRSVGERYSHSNTGSLPGGEGHHDEIVNICAMIEQKRTESRTLSSDLEELKEEKKSISGSFNAEGDPLKQIQTYKSQITHIQDELKALYWRIGAEASTDERRQIIDSFIEPEDKEILDSAAQINQSIHDDEAAIQKLQASLDIDDEKVKIEKYREMIQEKREKIARAEKNIAEFEESIRVSEASIEKLQKLLGE